MAKNTEVTTTDDKAAKRAAMADTRRVVRNFVYKGKNPRKLNHLGEMPVNKDEATRIIIALQDLLDTERAAHHKATTHIAALIEQGESIAESFNAASCQGMQSHIDAGLAVEEKTIERDMWRDRATSMRDDRNAFEKQVVELKTQIGILQTEKIALVQTVRILGDV
jgi:hypothetical protein